MKTCALLSICVKNQITFYETHLKLDAVALQIHVLTQTEYHEHHAQFWFPYHKSIKLNWKNLEKYPGYDQRSRPVSVWVFSCSTWSTGVPLPYPLGSCSPCFKLPFLRVKLGESQRCFGFPWTSWQHQEAALPVPGCCSRLSPWMTSSSVCFVNSVWASRHL